MKEQALQVETLFEKTELYTRSSVELYKLKAIDKTADVVSTIITRLSIIVFITLFFLIMNIGIALLIGEALGKAYYGFFCVSGFYGLVGIILYAFRNKWIKAPVRNSIIIQALK